MASAAATADPHQGIQEGVSLVAGFHAQVEAVLIAAGVNSVGHCRVVDLFQDILSPGEPAFRLDDDKSRRIIGSLKKVVRANVGGRVLSDYLGILTAGLMVSKKH